MRGVSTKGPLTLSIANRHMDLALFLNKKEKKL